MGIEDLFRWVKVNHSSALMKIPLSSFSNCRIAIDSTNFLYKIWAASFRDIVRLTDVLYKEVDRQEVISRCLGRFYDFLRRILSYGIEPVFVFDGEYSEDKKTYAHVRRRKGRDRALLKLKELEEEISLLPHGERGQNYIEAKRKLILQTEGPEQELEHMKNVICCLGLPCITAYGEAEKLCSQLCYEGRVEAVLSSDSDNLVHGCLLLLTSLTSVDGEEGVEAISLPKLLQSTGLSFSSFIDFSIMCGCDYNTNIKGIGIVHSYTLITEYKSIENLPLTYRKKVLDVNVLNYQRCREIFALTESEKLAEEIDLKIIDPDYETLRELGVNWGLDIYNLVSALTTKKEERIITRL